ncbi:MAG: ATP-dependent zinc metalloprotease FtsH 1 [Candidatus Yanofskybacteria bacterium GW2011_GWD2_39_48]|uniref:ATP-dependent zinc metalloprotease FtsH 1 n=1 Tax=Candidatus Yanofskybacteria bacterium GW2011_GWD2_39_48 TaxID=1619031 RepID=A0A0G0P5K3_9BACT|nr:MAG: ATP-dependent zinc metalloprotease FtsH 1 [Candidatus Yanofskybacteria bacterium GW2011_GWD2_39_48]
MSETLGPVTFGEKEELVFLGKDIANHKNYSETVAHEIDLEVQKLIQKAQALAKKVLIQKDDVLKKIAMELIKKETLEQKEFFALVNY